MVAVGEKGSAFIVTDSKATARVVVAWLIKIGFLLVAAFDVLKPQASNRTNGRIKPFAAQQGKLVFIQDGLRRDFRMTLQSQVRSCALEGPPLGINQGSINIPLQGQQRLGLLDAWEGEKAD